MSEDEKKEPENLPLWREAWLTILLLVYIVAEPVERWWSRKKR